MAIYQVCVDRLSADVSWVLLAWPLQECEVARTDSLLDPELGDRQVANPANASAATDANRGTT
eukprot:15448729-Alexandrium_andersonii.AAC.1